MKELIDNKKIFADIEKELSGISAYFKEPIIRDPFYTDFKYAFCWSSNALEGNTLTLEETIEFLTSDEVKSGHKYSEYEEAKRLEAAIAKFCTLMPKQIDETYVKGINRIIMDTSGYRTRAVYVGKQAETIYYPPAAEEIYSLMEKYMADINFTEKSIAGIIEKTAQKHIEFERIHPFVDGNGRTGRIILNQNLINNGLLPVIITPKSKYSDAFKRYDKTGDISPMAHIIAKGELNSLEKMKMLIGKAKEQNLLETKEKPPKFTVEGKPSKAESFVKNISRVKER